VRIAGQIYRATSATLQRQYGGMETMRGRRRLRLCCGDVNLARPSDWAMARQRTRPHPEPRRKWRRHVVKRSATIAAMILRRALDAQPVATRRTIRIQTLHRPTGQILHSFASQTHGPRRRREEQLPPRAPRTAKAPKLARLCAGGPSESRGIYTISSGTVAKLWKTHEADSSKAPTDF
jgi:hypothetical protein